jgi:hypothetical protein
VERYWWEIQRDSVKMMNSIAPPTGAAPLTEYAAPGNESQHEQHFASLMANEQTERFDAQPAAGREDIVSAAVSRLDGIAQGLRADPATEAQTVGRGGALLAGDPASASPPAPDVTPSSSTPLHDEVSGLIAHYGRMVSFQIKAQLTATASNSTQKTFNQLLRGGG